MTRIERCFEPDGREVTAIEDEGRLAIYHGKREITTFGISHEVAGELGWFLLKCWLRHQARWAWLQLRPWAWEKHGQA